jgi:hypothetical protein
VGILSEINDMNPQYKKSIIPFLAFALLTLVSFSQLAHKKGEYLNFIKGFYKEIYSKNVVTVKNCSSYLDGNLVGEYEENVFEANCKKKGINDDECGKMFDKHIYHNFKPASVFFLEIKKLKSKITQNLSSIAMDKLLRDSSEFIDLGEAEFVLVKINFPEKRFVYFCLNRYPDEKISLIDLFLSNGQSYLNNIIHGTPNYLSLPGKINDPDGYVNVRSQADANSPIIAKIKVGDIFNYVPNSYSNWWKVEKDSDPNFSGYVYFNRLKLANQVE